AQRRDFLHFTRGPDRHRELATPLQHDQAPRLNRIQTTSTRGVRARIRRVAGCATPTGFAGHAGATANLKLTFHLDHSAGADQLFRKPPFGRIAQKGSVIVRSPRTNRRMSTIIQSTRRTITQTSLFSSPSTNLAPPVRGTTILCRSQSKRSTSFVE